ncbi:MAG: ATP-binding protein, partial [Anaerolineae bacterium]|nr:ATP-binding protein [Anaerolineae bacterium]
GVARDDPNTPTVYRDPAQFFQQTYLTHSLHALLTDVMNVLRGAPGDRVLQLRTPFGGGKTHTLIALYHAVRSRHQLPHLGFTEIHDLPDPGACAVAAVECEQFDSRKGRTTADGLHLHTLWGEIAYQLAGSVGYEYVRLSDENFTAPGGETLSTLLRDLGQPALILLDEILNHVEAAQTIIVGDSTLGRQLLIFLKNLTEAVSASRNAALVYSLQASQMGEHLGAESLLQSLDHLVSRLDAKRVPVSGGEVMRVVQRRLFKEPLGDKAAARQTAAAYADAYRRVSQAVGGLSADEQHQAAQEAEKLADRILDSYPFHPDLLDLMYHRWGSLPSYQRTRGALQFLASVVYDLWEHGRDLQPLIGAGDVPLDQDNTRNAFFTQVGQRENYSSVMDVDLTGHSARAARVDRCLASDSPALQRYRVGTRLASSVMLYSFGAREGEERGVSEADLVQAASVPGLDRMPLTTALNDLRNELLYLHFTGRRYRFETQPNLNKLIDDETKKFSAEEVSRRIQTNLERTLQTARGAVIWPADSGRVNDHVPMLQVVYLPLDWAGVTDEGELSATLATWLEYSGNTRREFKNGLVFAIPGYMPADNLYSTAREALAIESLIRDKRRFNFNADQLKDLTARAESCQDRLTRGILSLYEKLALPVAAEDTPYVWRFVELQSRNELSLHDRVLGALSDSRLVFDSVTPDKLIALTTLSDTRFIKTDQVVTWFFGSYNFTRLVSADAIAAAIVKGVADGKLGFTAVWNYDGTQVNFPNRDLIYFERTLRTDEVDLSDALIIDAVSARELTYVPPPPPPGPKEGEEVGPGDITPPTPPPPPTSAKKRYRVTVRADKSKVFKVFRAIQNLTERSDRVTMSLEISAESDSEFDPVWLRNAVEEPLDEADVDARWNLE